MILIDVRLVCEGIVNGNPCPSVCTPAGISRDQFRSRDAAALRSAAKGWHRFRPRNNASIGDYCPRCAARILAAERSPIVTPPSLPRSLQGAPLTMYVICRVRLGVYRLNRIKITPGVATVEPGSLYEGSLNDCRRRVPPTCDCLIGRSPDDDPAIVESWV